VAPRAQPQPAAVEDDLLGDNDPEISNKLNSETTELANLSNQIGSLSKQMQDVQGQRATTQNALNQASAQKQNFEQRLAQLRSAYEKEARDVRALETQLANARNDTKKLQTELAMLDGSHQDLQGQHSRVLAALQADQQENAALKERIRVLNGEIAQLKPQIEKLKSEARQQKGLVAINKKQLATNEGERDKLHTEVQDLTKENEELARQVHASSQPPTHVASPALSATSANNPFFRRTGSTDIATAFASPPARAFNDTSFDDVFGPSPSFPAPSHSSTPPPASAFKPQTTGTSIASVTSGSFATPTSASPTVSRAATVTAEPPAPPESAQISSSNLPLRDAPDSVTSSRQVSPPLSRISQPETPAAEPQAPILAAPAEITRTEPTTASLPEPEPAQSDVASPNGDMHSTSDAPTPFFPAVESFSTPAGNASDPFAAMDQVKAKDDFESAFASFKKARAQAPEPATDATKAFATEFPPISELEHDDDSDSESERGFDDDFAPASPPPKPAAKSSDGSKPSSPTLAKTQPADTTASPSSGSGVAVERPSTRSVNPLFLMNHIDMLTDAHSDKPSSPLPVAASVVESHADDIFGSDAPHQPVPSTHPAPASAASNAFDDLDDDFEGLEDAKEGSADDDFANISRSGLDDFNPVFDSSPPPSQAAKSDSNNAHFGTESSFDFASLSTGSAAGSNAAVPSAAASQPAPSGGKAAESHDWDAIFASLDDGQAAPTAQTQASPPPAAAAPPAASEGAKKQPERPSGPGRLLTEAGVHDDPILKNLTSMGYSRQDALLALEKYDYNLERVSTATSKSQSPNERKTRD
jgi:epidermal growth factor receptor substrate 15